MELREALDSIATIRRRMAESEVFRGYRALPVALSAIFALLAGFVQPAIVPRPEQDVAGYVGTLVGRRHAEHRGRGAGDVPPRPDGRHIASPAR